MHRGQIILVGLVALCGFGCARQLVYPGTSAYKRRIHTFKVTPEAATTLAEAEARRCVYLAAVIDREYLFSKPYKYSRIDLSGTYVNGDTGRVVQGHSRCSLTGGMFFPYDMPRRLPAGVTPH